MAKIVISNVGQDSTDEAHATVEFTGLKAGGQQKVAKLFSDLGQALQDGKLDLMEDIQLALDLKAALS